MILRWEGRDLVSSIEPESAPEVIDSWLVSHGVVAGWAHHRHRFAASLPGIDTEEFLDAAYQACPEHGRWFPRAEAHGGQLFLRLRPAPELRHQTVLHIPEQCDPRSRPKTKGPDLAVLAQLRLSAQGLGADDALLYGSDGRVVEAAHAAIAWWEDDRLMFPEHSDQLPSVTVAATREVLNDTGSRPISVEELSGGLPVWVGSALHGWTPVTGWIGAEGTRWQPATFRCPYSTTQVNDLIGRR
ncbi:aminotransferase class IV [Corynebacterium alimapuense]|uniref:Aminotransferase n=1 Tax=Corynebacterium alimapuense TaxID=1576874 RepID=A0A3M8K5S1_9CORY|nr:aminotransferase class IV [Corynebacterium alimapuense]RNE48526.1 hypothetical protein C5L39_08505 [Corynebacterium alimapuense]